MNKYLIVPCSMWLLVGCASNTSRTVSNAQWNPQPQDPSGQHGDAGFGVDPGWSAAQLAASHEQVGQGGTGPPPVATESITGAGGGEVSDQANIDLYKEELVVGKREISNGGVLIRRVVQTENVSQPVELRREEYVIERIPASNTASASAETQTAGGAFQEKAVYISLTREEAVAGKRVLLTENIRVGKRVDTDHVTVTRPVRSEDVAVVKVAAKAAGNAQTASSAASAATEVTPDRDSMKLAREELVVGKREVDNGGVRLQKIIHTQDASQGVDLRREEFTIDRQLLNDQVVDAAHFSPREIRIDLTREEAVPTTRGYLAETVRVRKQIQTDKQVVSGTVRRENVEIAKDTVQGGSISPISSQSTTGQGGTGMAGQVGVSSTSDSGYALGETNVTFMTDSRDQTVTANVRAALAKGFSEKTTDTFDYSKIEVITRNVVVTLRGTVGSDAEKQLIAKRVAAIEGVGSVRNELRIVPASNSSIAK